MAALVDAEGAVRVEEGEAGAEVWRVVRRGGGSAYLKIGEGDVAEDVRHEAERLAWLNGRLPCARVLDRGEHEGRTWLLSSAVAGWSSDAWLAHDPARLPMVIEAFAWFARTLHALPPDDCPFDASADVRLIEVRRRVAKGLVDEDDFDDDHAGWSAARVLAAAERIRSSTLLHAPVVTHGDLSLGNVLMDDAGQITGCIDVGRLGRADRYQDIAILWQNLSEHGPEAQQRFVTAYGLHSLDPARLSFHRLLDELF